MSVIIVFVIKQIVTNKIFILISLVVLFVIISSIEGNTFFQKKTNEKTDDKNQEQVLEDKDNGSGKDKMEEETIVEESEIVILTPTLIPSPTNIPNTSNDFLIYPNSKIISKNNSEVVLESNANTDEITDWYKGKIDEYDMSVTSTVRTTTNGNVLNKLSAAGSNLKVEIEISRSNSSNITKITAKLL